MTIEELKALIEQGEGYNLEFKQSIPSKPSDLATEICAFANAAGGLILLGVTDRGSISGITVSNKERSQIQGILKTIDPAYSATMKEIKVDSKTVLTIECPSGDKKPYLVSGSMYVRNGPNSEKVITSEKLREFYQQADRIFFDETINDFFDVSVDFDFNKLESFRTTSGISTSVSTDQMIRNLRLAEEKKNDKIRNGAILLFANDVQKFFDHAIIRCVLFKGTDKRYILDSKDMTGNLIDQYDGAMLYLKSKLNLRFEIEGQSGGQRKEVLEIPEAAFREAIINSLCHRDYYEKGANIMVEIYDNRVIISNPGGLVNSIPREEFGTRSFSRNPLVFGLMQRMQMVEKIGSGIERIRDAMQDADLTAPVFQMSGFFTVTFFRPVDFEIWLNNIAPNLTTSLVKIIQATHDNPSLTTTALIDMLGQSRATVDRYLAQLKKIGILTRTGSRKSGKWVINLVPVDPKLFFEG
ncbi:MAG: helix-turn-helix domain-containing protein [Sediminibacterium sp.]